MYKQKTFRPASALDNDDDYSDDDDREPPILDYESLAVLSFFDSLSRGSFLAAAGNELTQYIYMEISKKLSSWKWSDLRKVRVTGGRKTYIRYCVIIKLDGFPDITSQYNFQTPTNTLSGVFIRNNQLFLPAGIFLAYGAYNTYQTKSPENTCDNVESKLKEQKELNIKLEGELSELKNIKIQNLKKIKNKIDPIKNTTEDVNAIMKESEKAQEQAQELEKNLRDQNNINIRRSNNILRKRIKKLLGENKGLQKENTGLQEENKELKQENKGLQEKIKVLERELENNKNTIDGQQQRIDELEKQNKSPNNSNAYNIFGQRNKLNPYETFKRS